MGKVKITKEQLIKENASLNAKVEALLKGDIEIRTCLSELLGKVTWERQPYERDHSKKVEVLDWIGIAFLMGKLKQDSEYSNLLKANEKLREENSFLQNEKFERESGMDMEEGPMVDIRSPRR